MDELVEFLALAFICLAEFADLTVVLIDDFQWVDSFSWKIFRVLVKRGKKLLLLCAMRSHDKQAMRRLSTAATKQVELQNHMVEISLLPLDVPDIKVLMSRVLGYNKKLVPDSLCVDVFQRSGGLPVYVVQMLEDMKRRKTVEIGEKGVLEWTALGLKEKVRDVLAAIEFYFLAIFSKSLLRHILHDDSALPRIILVEL
jgi:predicted ATPase